MRQSVNIDSAVAPGVRPQAVLPATAEGCAREMEQLGKHQRMITERMRVLTTQLQQLLRKQTRPSVTKKLEAKGITGEEEAGEKKTVSTAIDEQASDVVSDSEEEGAEVSMLTTSRAELYYMDGAEGDDVDTNEVSSPLISALKKLQQRRDQKRGI